MFRPVSCCQCLCIMLSWLPLVFFVVLYVLFVCLFRPVSCCQCLCIILSWLPFSFSPCFVLCLVASVSVLSYLDCPLVFLHVSSCVLLPVSLYYSILTAPSFLCHVICVVCLFVCFVLCLVASVSVLSFLDCPLVFLHVSSCVLLPVSLYYPILTAP